MGGGKPTKKVKERLLKEEIKEGRQSTLESSGRPKHFPTDEEVNEFLQESNAIEREYGEIALQDAHQAWNMACICAKDFEIDYILGIHRRLMKILNHKIAGHFRKQPVYVGNQYEYRECLDYRLIDVKLKKLVDAWNDNKENLKEMPESTKEVFIKQWHINFEGIHPFLDGNGRVGRILMNVQRLSVGLPLLIIHEGREQFEYYKWFKSTTI